MTATTGRFRHSVRVNRRYWNDEKVVIHRALALDLTQAAILPLMRHEAVYIITFGAVQEFPAEDPLYMDLSLGVEIYRAHMNDAEIGDEVAPLGMPAAANVEWERYAHGWRLIQNMIPPSMTTLYALDGEVNVPLPIYLPMARYFDPGGHSFEAVVNEKTGALISWKRML